MDGHEFPLTWAQYWTWVAQHETPAPPAALTGHVTVPVPDGELSVSDVEGAVRWLVRRHEGLRTRFRMNGDGYPVQLIEEDFFPVVRVIESPAVLRDKEAEQAIGVILRPFELGEEPPIRAALVTVTGVPTTLHLVMHHIVCDNTAVEIAKSEIRTYLDHAVRGDVPQLPAPEWSPRQQWEFESSARGAELNRRAVEYWRELHERQPCDVHPVRVDSPPSGGCRVRFSSDEVGKLCEVIAKREGCFDAVVLMTAFAASFANVKGRDVTVFKSLLSNRQFPKTKGYVGNIVEMGRILVDFGRFPTLRDVMKNVMTSTMKGMRYGQVGALRIHDPKLGVEPIVDWTPTEGGILFNYVPASSSEAAWPDLPSSTVETTEYQHQAGNSILVINDHGIPRITMYADRDFLSPEQAESVVTGLPVLLEQFWRDPELTRLDFQGVLPRWTAPSGWIDWRGCWIHELDLKAMLEAFPGVRAAYIPTRGSKERVDHLVVGVVGTPAVTPSALREHLLNTRWPSGISVVPAEFVIRQDAPHDTDSVEAWCDEPGTICRGTGREDGGDNDETGESPAEKVLLQCIGRVHPSTRPRLSGNYGEARGEYIKIPAVVAGLRAAGYEGLRVQDFTSPFSLRKLAAQLTPCE
ncbi:condensation domain-containing protein [Streptomyces canus]|uniref:condensation domain-containing protein n=1 Tax=Streptomyces canus TaxID=58343 RepID=UPI003249C900